jgi:hypothetical protein
MIGGPPHERQPAPTTVERSTVSAPKASMAAFLFFCPNTGYRVKGWVADDGREDDRETYESVSCHACGQVPLVNPRAGRELGGQHK